MLPLRVLRPCRSLLHSSTRFSRAYNGATNTTPHPTYFQPPPQPPKSPWRIGIWSSLLLATTSLGAGAYAHSWLYDLPLLGIGPGGLEEGEALPLEAGTMQAAMVEAVRSFLANNVPAMDLERCQEALESGAGYTVTPTALSHSSQLGSNLPCEDHWDSGKLCPIIELLFFASSILSGRVTHPYVGTSDHFGSEGNATNWCEWSIFDGHAGPRTAQALTMSLAGMVMQGLADDGCFDRPYSANDPHTIDTIKQVFLQADEDMVQHTMEQIRSGLPDRAGVVASAAAAFSGSCALLALYDPVQHVLRVANTGDSRAVLGRWDGTKYIAHAMSVDQTGFNEMEVARITEQHPGEDVVDPKTGRVHGLAVSRAFGDARWKWPQEVSKRAFEMFWGPSPRPDSMIKTPPYLTAEPEVTEVVVQTGDHPDFLVMASDGLWDNMSSDDAISCVQMWLDKNKPTDFMEQQDGGLGAIGAGRQSPNSSPPSLPSILAPVYTTAVDVAEEDEDVYFDEEERCLRWRVSPKHFVVEDAHCGVHLIKNALGGKRRDLFTGVMSVQPPLSRRVRDDITVHVVFFGMDNSKTFEQQGR
ncbi:hypothetical protein B0A54_16212 [Friedmanniomyces endolithicus]|uniref:PPM-type phosphatase domain-containing protein n=1 Tax=Friedmanniomyces endolithicus TaxID=329885 RepID=A0A4U0U3L0_9PEZI|nr:hypothetical protein B0A54_16212 [Friedmanniomyces endolithicus]